MSYNGYNFFNPSPLVSFTTAANSNADEGGSQTTASTLTTPVEPQGGWPARNSQEKEGPPQKCNENSNTPPMPLSSNNVQTNMNALETGGYGVLPNVAGLGIDSGLGQNFSSQLGDAVWGNWLGDISGGSYSSAPPQLMASNVFVDDFGFDTTVRFDTPTPLEHFANNQESSGDGGALEDIHSSNNLGSSAFNTSTQLAEAPHQDSMQQGEQCRADVTNEAPKAQQRVAPSHPTSRLAGSPKVTESESILYPTRDPTTATGLVDAMQIDLDTVQNVQQQLEHQVPIQGSQEQRTSQILVAEQQKMQHGVTQGHQVGPRNAPPYPSSRSRSQDSNLGFLPFGASEQLSGQGRPSMGAPSAGTRCPGSARHPGPLRLLAPAPSNNTPEQTSTHQSVKSTQKNSSTHQGPQPTPRDRPQGRRQSTPQAQRRGPTAQNSPSQPSPPQYSDPLFPGRLSPATAALADVTPANQFIESVSSMHLLDRMACVEILMRSDLIKDYVKPHLWVKFDEGLAKGGRVAARGRLGMSDTADEVERKHAGQTMRRKVEFQDKQIQNERRLRERAGVATSNMINSASETGKMTPTGSKRRRQTSGSGSGLLDKSGDDSFDSDSDHLNPSRLSPKKSRHLHSTPSELVNKFCSVVNIGNRNPFFDDVIHTQLRRLNTLQLIDAAPEYVAQHGELSDTKVEHWRACAGQAAGVVMDEDHACKHCADHIDDGSVPFASCVAIDDAQLAGKQLHSACMNCVYLGKDQQCSLRRIEGESNRAQ